jgi:uncharacterized protein DUF6884
VENDRPVRELLRQCAQELAEPFTRADIVAWFARHHPDVPETTVGMHIQGLAIGVPDRNIVFPYLSRCPPVLRRLGTGMYVRAARAPSDGRAPAEASSEASAEAPTTPSRARVAIVGCPKSDDHGAGQARSLHPNELFVRRVRHVEALGVPWFVASCRHGLVRPDEVVSPDDIDLADQPVPYRTSWAGFVAESLRQAVGDLGGSTVELHAGEAYVAALRGPLERLGAHVVDEAGIRS